MAAARFEQEKMALQTASTSAPQRTTCAAVLAGDAAIDLDARRWTVRPRT